jgi:PAS domain S-box-containing protein
VALRAGACDFVLKDNLTRLVPAIDREARESQERAARRRAEADLRASESRYRALFESSPLPMWVYDTGTLGFLAVNEAAVRHYGYSREEFASMSTADIRRAEDQGELREDFAHRPSVDDGTESLSAKVREVLDEPRPERRRSKA